MASSKKSVKHNQIDKANARIVLIVSLASIVAAFAIVSSKALLSQRAYQSRVIGIEKSALKVAETDLKTSGELAASYQNFNSKQINIIKGSRDAVVLPGQLAAGFSQDGPNAKIVLDALPSKYDFPGLISSLERLLKQRGFKVNSLSGSDDPVQAAAAAVTSPVPVDIPFQFSVTGSYKAIQDLTSDLGRSIRPITITRLQITGSESELTLDVSAKTAYQPAKTFVINTKVVK